MHDEIAHLRIINGHLRLGLPGRIGGSVIGEDADHVDLRRVLEFRAVERLEFAAENEMEKLLGFARMLSHVLPCAPGVRCRASEGVTSLFAPARA